MRSRSVGPCFFIELTELCGPLGLFFHFFCVSLSVCATREIPNEDRHYGGPFLFDQRPPSLTIFGPFRSRNATLISQTTGRVSVSLISDVIGRFVFSPVLRHVHRETVGFCYLTASRNGRSKSRTSLQTSCRSNHQSGEPTTKLRRARPRGRVGCCGKKKSPSFMFCLMEAVEDAAVRSAAVSCSDCIGSLKKVSVCFCFFLLSQIKFEVGISSVIFKRNASLFFRTRQGSQDRLSLSMWKTKFCFAFSFLSARTRWMPRLFFFFCWCVLNLTGLMRDVGMRRRGTRAISRDWPHRLVDLRPSLIAFGTNRCLLFFIFFAILPIFFCDSVRANLMDPVFFPN